MARKKKNASKRGKGVKDNNWIYYLAALIVLIALVGLFMPKGPCSGSQNEVDNCFLVRAVDFQDPNECSSIKNSDVADTCYSELGISLKDYSVCDLAPSAQGRDSCAVQLALEDNDSSVCFSATNNYWNDFCFDHFAPLILDADFCANIIEPDTRSECFFDMAQALNETVLCNYTKLPRKDTCYLVMAVKLNDSDICFKSEFSDVASQDLCKLNIGILRKDDLFCRSIQDLFLRRTCFTEANS